jgi:hypothetical protein
MDNLKRRHIPGQQDSLADFTEESHEAYNSIYGNEKKMHKPIPVQPPVIYSSNKVCITLLLDIDSFYGIHRITAALI